MELKKILYKVERKFNFEHSKWELLHKLRDIEIKAGNDHKYTDIKIKITVRQMQSFTEVIDQLKTTIKMCEESPLIQLILKKEKVYNEIYDKIK